MILTFEQKDTKGAHVFQNMEDRLKKGVYINKLGASVKDNDPDRNNGLKTRKNVNHFGR